MVTCSRCGQENPEGFAFCGACGASLEQGEPARDVRKTVTVVFSDVTGSTRLGEQLDPESLRRVMGRYFDEMQAVVESHGGMVEKFIGDAVMAVFGIPVLHEDDALRAIRAAAEMRERLAALNAELEKDWGVTIAVRTGVNTGEVVAGDASGGQRFATGDAVNVAKRFEEAAPPGEILLGETTWKLVRDAVDVEPIEGLELKGKGELVSAYRLRSIEPGAAGRARRLDSPMVGRERERALLEQAYERTAGERACHLFTVLGAAGVGKSRLIAEFLEGVSESATVVRGRCLSYGEGITFWPVLEVVRELVGDDVISIVVDRLAGDKNAELIATRVAGAVGLAEGPSASEETSWAVRKLLEAHARERPLVILFDDVQWGEPTFLDLVEHIADLSRDAPILLVCLARPELLDVRPGWAGGKFNATSVLLEPLSDDDSAELIDNLLGRAELDPQVRTRVAEAAEGNPLFVEEMLGMLIDDRLLERQNGNWVAKGDLKSVAVPPTIHALLSARLDRLEPAERAVVERASVEGKVFHRGAVAELSSAEVRGGLGSHLQTLVRKELLRPDRADFAGEDAFRFRHLLIRDAAYDSMPKELRAQLHEVFAAWLERMAGDRVLEYEAILGFHLEQAYRYREELAPVDEGAQALGARAGVRLASAGQRAFARNDAPAAINLLDRALSLLPAESPARPKLLCDLGLALTDRGEFPRAEAVLTEAARAAEAVNEPALAAIATLRSTWVRLLAGGARMEESKADVEESVHRLEELGDEDALAEAYSFLGTMLMWTGMCADAVEVLEHSASLARRTGADKVASRSLSWLLVSALWGPMAVADGLVLCDRIIAEGSDRYVEGFASFVQGVLRTMAGDWEEGRALIATGRTMLEELGQRVNIASMRMASARSEFFAGRLRESENDLRLGYDVLDQMGEKGYLSTIASLLAVVVRAQGRDHEAEVYAQEARELGADDDRSTQLYWRCAQAEVLASRGDIDEALQLVQEAQEVIEGTDLTIDRAAALLSRAFVEKAAGTHDRARIALDQALGLFEEKGDVTAAAHTRGLLDAV
jgi:class 3 adenylate cyclase/tetratricopeptide (TPR) repeat protein